MKLVIQSVLMRWTQFKEHRQLKQGEYIEWQRSLDTQVSKSLVFVSHRWIIPNHPDHHGDQLRELQSRLGVLCDKDATYKNALIFYDYCSLFQRPRTSDEEVEFYRDLGTLENLSRRSDKFIILSEGYTDYKNRAWCFFEVVNARRDNIYYFGDQSQISDDVGFFAIVLGIRNFR